jgi:hypothetical protein
MKNVRNKDFSSKGALTTDGPSPSPQPSPLKGEGVLKYLSRKKKLLKRLQ